MADHPQKPKKLMQIIGAIAGRVKSNSNRVYN